MNSAILIQLTKDVNAKTYHGIRKGGLYLATEDGLLISGEGAANGDFHDDSKLDLIPLPRESYKVIAREINLALNGSVRPVPGIDEVKAKVEFYGDSNLVEAVDYYFADGTRSSHGSTNVAEYGRAAYLQQEVDVPEREGDAN